MRGFPVIVEAAFLKHSQQIIISHRMRRRGNDCRCRRLAVIRIRRHNLVMRSLANFAEKVRIPVNTRSLHPDWLEMRSVE